LENTSNETSEFVDRVQVTPELLESIRAKMHKEIKRERKKERKKQIIKLALFLIVFLIVIYVFNHNWKWVNGFVLR
jgi:t-SNARE complex subunit (syntaxin)